jgi:PAS domain S-box-containing protein
MGLVGWATGVDALVMLVTGQPPMMPNTAVALVLLGMAGALRGSAYWNRTHHLLAALSALTALAIGVVTILEYLLDLPLSIDQIVIRTSVGPFPGRPSPPTAIALTLLAAALLSCEWRSTKRICASEWLSLGAGLIAFTFIAAQVFGAGPLYRFSDTPVVGVAIPTALSVLLVSVGLLLEQPGSSIVRIVTSPKPGDMMLRRLAFALIAIALSLGVTGSLLVEVAGVGDAVVRGILTVGGIVSILPLFAITARRLNHAHEALERLHAQTRQLIELASDGIFIADLDGRYREVNDVGVAMLGYSREEILGKTILDLIPADDEPRLRQDRERFLHGGTAVGEWRLLKKDGTYLPVEVSAKILPDGRWQGIVRDISERRRADAALRQAQERLELALEGADLATWDWNVTTGEVVFNSRWAEMRAFRPDEIAPNVDSWSSGVHPDDWPRVQKLVTRCFEGAQRHFECEYRAFTRSGEWIWVLDRGKVFARDDQGKPTRMAGTELDVSARRRAEDALRLSEAKFSGIVSMAADAIISTDESGRITLFNAGAEKVFARSRAEVIGAPLDILMPERFRVAHAGHLHSFAAGPDGARRMGARATEIIGLRSTGEEFPADAAISSFSVGGKRVLTAVLRDITEQKLVEKEHRLLADMGAALAGGLELEAPLADIAQLLVRDLADYCIVDVVEDDGSIRRAKVVSRDAANEGVCDALSRGAFDWSALEWRQGAFVRVATPDLIDSWAQDTTDRAVFQSADFRSVITAPLCAHGKCLGALSLIAASGVAGLPNLRLVEKVAERLALFLQSSRLYVATKRATRARDDVLAVVAHDVRSPLAAVAWLAAVLKRGAEREIGEEIGLAVNRIDRLIEDLLDVTRIEGGRLTLRRARLPVDEIISDALDAHLPLASSASIELGRDAAPDLPDVWADRDRLSQVFGNLIGNALEFTKPAGRITVGATARADEVLFSVSDTGCGIPSSHLPHVFDRFWQGPGAARRGMGFGLSIVKGIVEAHGGRVAVESTVGRGTTFFFTLPAARSRASESVHLPHLSRATSRP